MAQFLQKILLKWFSQYGKIKHIFERGVGMINYRKYFFIISMLIVSLIISTFPAESRKVKKLEVYGKVVKVDIPDGYINIENQGETIPVTFSTSTQIKYNNKTISPDEIKEGDLIKASGSYIDGGVIAEKIDIISRQQQGNNTDGVIKSVSHNCTGIMKPGDILKVTMTGSRGGAAFFNINNLANGIPLKEISGGTYQGEYTIRSDDKIENGVITAYLVMPDGKKITAQAGNPVNINVDLSEMVISQILPKENSTIDNSKPNILLVIQTDSKNKGIVTSTAKLAVNGINVTSKAQITENVITYRPADKLPEGTNKVTFSATDYRNRQFTKSWSFNVQTGGQNKDLIYSVTHNGQNQLHPGNKLIVNMSGISGGKATFDIGSYRTGIAMKEKGNGIYTGEYIVTKKDSIQNVYILCHLETSSGQKESLTSEEPLTSLGPYYNAGVSQPEITEPDEGDTVSMPLTVRGRTVPGYKVQINVTWQISVIGVLNPAGSMATKTVTADSDGNFETQFTYVVNFPSGTKYTIKAITIAPDGQKSPETIVNVVQD